MDTRWLGWTLFAIILGGLALFPWFDARYLRFRPPLRADASGGALAIEPLFSVTFGGGAFILALVTAYAAAHQSSIVGGVLSAAFLSMGLYVSALAFQVRVVWDKGGLEQRKHWPGKNVHIPWNEIVRLGGNEGSPDFAETADGRRVSWALCRGRLAFFDAIRSMRPDLPV